MKNVKFIRYNNYGSDPAHVRIKTDDWLTDKGFRPHFYVYGLEPDDIENFDTEGKIIDLEDDVVKSFWNDEEIDVSRVTTKSPSDVSRLGYEISQYDTACVFATDVPYLTNYLLHSKTKIYEGVKELKTIILDFEADVEDIDKAIGTPFMAGISEGIFDLEELIYYEKEPAYCLIDRDRLQLGINTSKKLLENDLVVCHNVKFDIGLLAKFLKRNEYWKFSTKQETCWQGTFRHEKFLAPRDLGFFDTVYATDVAMYRPKYSPLNLKRLVDSLEIREYDRVELDGKKIGMTFRENPQLVEKYCLHDVEDTKLLFNYLAPLVFAPAIHSGILVQQILLSGIKTVWETMLMRYCVENGYFVPHFSKKAESREKMFASPYIVDLPTIKGGHTIKPNVVNKKIENVYHVDVIADYPNIIEGYNISPETVFLVDKYHKFDANKFDYYKIEFEDDTSSLVGVKKQRGVLPEILEPIINKTVQLKKLSKENKKLEQAYKGFKGLRNSSFGFMGIREGDTRFPNVPATALITQLGRNIVETMIEAIEEYREVKSKSGGLINDNEN